MSSMATYETYRTTTRFCWTSSRRGDKKWTERAETERPPKIYCYLPAKQSPFKRPRHPSPPGEANCHRIATATRLCPILTAAWVLPSLLSCGPWKSKVGGVFGLTRTETASAKTIGTPNGFGNCRKPIRKLCSIKSVRRETADAQERGTFSVGAMASIFSLNRNGSGTTNFGDPSLSGWKLR